MTQQEIQEHKNIIDGMTRSEVVALWKNHNEDHPYFVKKSVLNKHWEGKKKTIWRSGPGHPLAV